MNKFRTDIPGWLHSNEVNAITRICKMIPRKTSVIEVGVFAGRTTQVIADVITNENIYCVDPWPTFDHPVDWGGMTDYTGPAFENNDVENIFRREVVSKFKNVFPIKGLFPQALPMDKTDRIGLVHWDTDCVGDVALMKQQFRVSWALLCKGGILSGHTFAAWMPSVVQAAREFSMEVKCDIVLPPSGSIWYMIKP
jgi:hypothetical protein